MVAFKSTLAVLSVLALGISAQQCAIGGDASIVALAGDSVGTEQVVNGSELLGASFAKRNDALTTILSSQHVHHQAGLLCACHLHSGTVPD